MKGLGIKQNISFLSWYSLLIFLQGIVFLLFPALIRGGEMSDSITRYTENKKISCCQYYPDHFECLCICAAVVVN